VTRNDPLWSEGRAGVGETVGKVWLGEKKSFSFVIVPPPDLYLKFNLIKHHHIWRLTFLSPYMAKGIAEYGNSLGSDSHNNQ
jgi:hypothetical protein